MPAPHQWLVDPTAILLRPHTALTLCTEPRCPKVARYLLQFPRQDALAYCHPHTQPESTERRLWRQSLKKPEGAPLNLG